MKKILSMLLVLVLLLGFTAATPKSVVGFTDVPKGHYFEEAINKLNELNVISGIGNGVFGFNKEITRAEFVTFLVRLQGHEPDHGSNPDMFNDVKSKDWFYPYINLGIKNKIIHTDEYLNNSFMPTKSITREEMAVMIVRAMDYDYLASMIQNQPSQFKDVNHNIGYVELAKDLGIISGRSKEVFDPAARATKQEAAAMLFRMYNKENAQLDTLHSFYAIKSFDQINKMNVFDSIGYGWSRLDYNEAAKQVELSTQMKTGGHPFYVPEDYQLAISDNNAQNISQYLMIFGSNEDMVAINGKNERLVSLLLNNDAAVDKLIGDIDALIEHFGAADQTVSFEGVVVDFEALRDNGIDKQRFTEFLSKLRAVLNAKGKKLMVCINPPREAGQPYYDGYDFTAIGQLADYVVLMAHDYDTKYISSQDMKAFKGETPLSPIKDIYYAVKYALNGDIGIPKDKLLLQISFSSAQWQFKDNVVLNNKPYNPDYSKIINRMRTSSTTAVHFNYSETYQAPYMTYEAEGIKNIIWYEDERSLEAKMKLAKLLGIKGLSFWRLGAIPDFPAIEDDSYNLDIWSVINQVNQ